MLGTWPPHVVLPQVQVQEDLQKKGMSENPTITYPYYKDKSDIGNKFDIKMHIKKYQELKGREK